MKRQLDLSKHLGPALKLSEIEFNDVISKVLELGPDYCELINLLITEEDCYKHSGSVNISSLKRHLNISNTKLEDMLYKCRISIRDSIT